MVDRVGHYKVLLTGITLYAVLFPLFQLFVDSLVGLGACIALSFGICAVCEVSVFPFIADIAEKTDIAHADTIAFATNEMAIQCGFAVGNVVGRQLVDWKGMVVFGWFIAGWDLLALTLCLVVIIFLRRKEKESPRKDDEIITN
jgi:predicted MFS family arabinose efflux permease